MVAFRFCLCLHGPEEPARASKLSWNQMALSKVALVPEHLNEALAAYFLILLFYKLIPLIQDNAGFLISNHRLLETYCFFLK